MLGVLLPCLTNDHSVQIGGLNQSCEAAAGCNGHSKCIRRVAELFQRNCLSEKIVPQKVVADIIDFEHRSGDKAASSEFTLSNAALDHHPRLISGAFDGAGKSLLVGASIKDGPGFYFTFFRNMALSLKSRLLH